MVNEIWLQLILQYSEIYFSVWLLYVKILRILSQNTADSLTIFIFVKLTTNGQTHFGEDKALYPSPNTSEKVSFSDGL